MTNDPTTTTPHRLDGCTCVEVAPNGSHRSYCAWSMRRGRPQADEAAIAVLMTTAEWSSAVIAVSATRNLLAVLAGRGSGGLASAVERAYVAAGGQLAATGGHLGYLLADLEQLSTVLGRAE